MELPENLKQLSYGQLASLNRAIVAHLKERNALRAQAAEKSPYRKHSGEREIYSLSRRLFPEPDQECRSSQKLHCDRRDRDRPRALRRRSQHPIQTKKGRRSQKLISDLKPGLTKKKVDTIELEAPTTFDVTITRSQCDTIAKQLYLRVRKNRG